MKIEIILKIRVTFHFPLLCTIYVIFSRNIKKEEKYGGP